jgi:uncharacterized protein with NRDE domain
MEYAKIDDPEVDSKMTEPQWKKSLVEGTYKGFNLVYGNVHAPPMSLYTNTNNPDDKNPVTQEILSQEKA